MQQRYLQYGEMRASMPGFVRDVLLDGLYHFIVVEYNSLQRLKKKEVFLCVLSR